MISKVQGCSSLLFEMVQYLNVIYTHPPLYFISTLKGERSGSVSCSVVGPVDCGLPGSSAWNSPGKIILEWAAIPFSRGYFHPRDRTGVSPLQADSLLSESTGKP